METINDLNVIAKDLPDRRIKRLGHIQDHHLDSIKFILRAAFEPSHHVLTPPAFKCCDWPTFVQVYDDRIVAMAFSPGVFINPQGSAQLSWPSATALVKRPAKHGARREAIATRQFFARATVKEFLAHLVVETLSPFDTGAKGLAFLPGPVVASPTVKTPQVQPQRDRAFQDG
jgi:hypothetical protein